LGYAHPNQITDTQFRLAMAIADLAGNALHRMSIADALEEMVTDRTRDLETIYRVAAASREKTDLKAALHSTLGPILESVNSQIGVILLIDEATLRTKVLVSVGLPPRIKQYIEKADDQNSIELWVLKNRLPLILPDLAADPRAHPMGAPDAHLPFVALPMRVGERIVGILEIARIEGSPFDLEELTLLFFIADHLGLVVENATLLHRAEQQAILQERSRLARDLHDSVTQSLYSATLFAEGSRRLIDQGDLGQARGKLSDLSQITQQALKEMRLMVYELRSPALRSEGLARAIQLRLESVELRAGVNATLDASLSGEIPEWIEEALYRIALEALNNSLKHAFAQNIGIVIRNRDGGIWMQVRDDGNGFNPALQDHPGGMGMNTMRDRAERLKGSLEIHTSPGEGTEVEVKIPFPQKGNPSRLRKRENG
jgi:signal transduction histidine kinase